MKKVKDRAGTGATDVEVRPSGRRRGFTRVSSKNQVTLPVAELHEAGLEPGDQVRVRADGAGRLVLERESSFLDFAGAATGAFPPGFLEEMRKEWDAGLPSWTPAS
jgi:bifunctional DNA-binding transcriptional regulator/antitoxin component of YhaV-PrlF toxin-antitoxin module